jgi:hypothetical protein
MTYLTKEWATQFAAKLRSDYPELSSVNEIIDRAKADGRFESEIEMLAVWGRLMRGSES